MGRDELTHWGRDKMAAVSQTTLSNAFSWMKMLEFRLRFKFVPKGPINNIPALVQIMAWRRSGDKPLSEPMMASLLTHICVTRPQWVKVMTWPVRCQAIVETSADFSCGPLWKLFSLNINMKLHWECHLLNGGEVITWNGYSVLWLIYTSSDLNRLNFSLYINVNVTLQSTV